MKSLSSLFKNQQKPEPDIDVTPFMSLMVVLIPVLLLNVQFSLIGQYDIYKRSTNDSTITTKINDTTPLKLVVDTDFIVLNQGDENIVSLSLKDRSEIELALGEQFELIEEKLAINLHLEASQSYQDVIYLLDFINKFKDKFSTVNVTVSEGLNGEEASVR